MKESVTGSYGKRRGGSRANTRFALDAVVNLSEATEDANVLGILNYLDGWSRRAEAVFLPEKALRRIPREPGQAEARCPYCARQTMRWNAATGVIVCLMADCLNGDGIRPRWVAKYAVVDNTLQFTWEELETTA